jgi:hypothetical protein
VCGYAAKKHNKQVWSGALHQQRLPNRKLPRVLQHTGEEVVSIRRGEGKKRDIYFF